MSNFQKLSSGALRGTQVQGTDIGSGSATSTQFLAANGSTGSAFRILAVGDIPSLSTIYLPLTGGTMSGAINMGSNNINALLDPTTAQQAATKNYVDTVAAGLEPLQSVYAGTIGSNIPGTYLNGASGIGATFTTTSTTSPFTLDGTTPPINSRILIKDQSTGFQNGVYNFTAAPVAGVSGAVFTRAFDYDQASDVNSGNIIPIINGTINAPSGNPTFWLQTATITNVGVDALVFIKFNQGGIGTVTSVALTVPSFLSISGSPITSSGTLAIGLSGTALAVPNGGTGQITLTNHGLLVGAGTSAITQLAAAGAGTFLTGQGAGSDPSFSSSPTLGIPGGTTGILNFASSGGSSVTAVQNLSGTSSYNFNLPATAGSSGQALTSAGGGSSVMTWSTIPTLTSLGIFSGKATISNGATSVSVTFSTAYGSTGYSITGTIMNTTDTNPAYIPVTVTAQSTTGATFSWNSPTPTANYVLNWNSLLSN